MWNDIVNFFYENKTSLLTNIVAGLVFFVLGPVLISFSNKKIRKEKLTRAKEDFLDILENMLVNKEALSKEKLSTLFNAVSRRHSVNMEIDTDLLYLLEDLALRFAKSKHLSPAQKDAYSEQIEDIKKRIEEKPLPEIRSIPKSYTRIVDELNKAVETDNKEDIDKRMAELKEKLLNDRYLRSPLSIYSVLFKRMKEKPVEFAVLSIITIVIYVFLIFKLTGKM